MSDVPAGLETLQFLYPGDRPAGAVGSGNLEVMLEAATDRDDCAVRVETSARGFGPIWQAVMDDFHARHPLGGLRVSINDMGATPAVVSLRLDQAVAAIGPIAPDAGGRP